MATPHQLKHYTDMAAEASAGGPFNAILHAFVSMQASTERCKVYHPEVGNRARVYRSLGDVMSYEAGFLAHAPGKAAGVDARTPYRDGWDDAQDEWQAGQEGGGEPVEAA